ncbi:NAD(P)-binding Rossmann-fold containing protein [Glarea lozoyensis ATCC 20868]|uniref:NAD(P)-binding Rossmann-fold containing protein n=1 Tax=Glarea lozoyensis (strain ATCC 20868 / MF5171) TaxID=1116229 RepID=S3CS81_GLAL2|nr:NAD(P)-binding Rossmann-fold containing protein [Glarea lozoyensis ATCC 20868]EPE28540.1 NAD(P)-binding Rossmann-fold containing protein [Glarea lozoyensis ATCC 20868]
MPLLGRDAVALITASSAGLGAATAKAFAASGIRVIINYNSSADKAKALVQELETLQPSSAQDSTPRFHIIQADVSKRSEIIRLVEESAAKMGRIDVVVSNHGWTRMRNFQNLDENVEESDWDTCFNFNVKSHLFLFHAAKPHLEKSEGSFLSTASLAGITPGGSSLAYSVTKAAQIHLVKGLAKTSGPKIRVNAVSPGLMLTEWGKNFPQSKIDNNIANSVLKRLASVEDVANMILCISNSSSQTGTNTVIEAGRTLS